MRRPSDIAMLVVASVLALLAGLWAQTESSVNVNLFRTFNDLSGNMEGLAKGIYALGSIWAVVAVTVVLLFARQVRAAWHGAIAGAGAWSLALLLNAILGTQSINGLSVNVRIGDGPAFPVANVAAITALAFGLAPYVVRPLRRVFAVVIVLVSFAAMYLGAGFPADVLGGLFVGFAVAALVRVALGAPGGSPSVAEVRSALTDLGYEVTSIRPADERIARASVMDVELASGERLQSRRFRARPAGRPRRRQAVAQGDVPRSRLAGVRESAPAGRAHRLRVGARRARQRRCGTLGPDRSRRVRLGRDTRHRSASGCTDRLAGARARHRRDARRRLAASSISFTTSGISHGNLDGLACWWTATVRSRSTTSAPRSRRVSSTGATGTTPPSSR